MIRFSIKQKFVLAFILLSILPLTVLGVYTSYNLWQVGQRAITTSTAQLESRARESIELRAVELANQVSQFLTACESDLFTLKMLPRNAETYREFSQSNRRSIWIREGTNHHPREVIKEIPLYQEIAFIDSKGQEIIRLSGDQVVPASHLRKVSQPQNTTYRSEHYFEETRRLKNGEVYVSHVTGWYVSRRDQLQQVERVEDAVEGKKFEGVVRFATPCFNKKGQFEGLVLLSLDHRHLMEMTMHILPTEDRFVVFPSYSSGNYAFMFDDEGWIISHPKFWDIRGLLPDGSAVGQAMASYTKERLLAGEIPFNLDRTTFINPNYPLIAQQVRAGRSGVTSTFNVGGIPRVMAYAPIIYNRGPYKKSGCFGGITIGVETAKFQEPALSASNQIDAMVVQTKRNTLIILIGTAWLAFFLATWLARTFTQPIFQLAEKAHDIACGNMVEEVKIHTGDEVEMLARNFTYMARQIKEHQDSLQQSVADLALSKKAVEQYTEELEKKLKVIKNVHYLSQYLGNVFDRELVLGKVLRICVEGLGYDRAILYLYDPARQRLFCHQTFGFSPRHEEIAKAAAYDLNQHNCIPTQVYLSGETIAVKDIHHEPRATPLDLKIAQVGEIDSFVFTPIKVLDQIIGILGADTATSRREFTPTEVEALEILANDAARAVERSQLYGQLLAERNFIKSIFTHMTSGIITLNEAGAVTWLNPYSEAVFQIKRDDVLGKPFSQVFQVLPAWIALIDHYLHRSYPEGRSLEYLSIFQEEKEKSLEVHFSTIYQEEDRQKILCIFLRDITQRRSLEDHVKRSDRLISLGVLAAGIAHEMRNPLTGISLALDDLHDHLENRPRDREIIQRSLQEIDRLENLINDLLDFAGPSRRPHLEVYPLGKVLQNPLFLINKMCKNQKINLVQQIDNDLPAVRLNPERMQQALLNLLLNSIQAMPEGGNLSVIIKTRPPDESLLEEPTVRLTVADTGIGIAPEDMPYIFDPFYSRRPAGTGLGLAIVHSIIEEHGGRISASSQPGQGTTFGIDLPVVK
jgi:PAS domain S-box-containing protein